MTTSTTSTAAATAASTITLTRVAADYKLHGSEEFLIQGRAQTDAPNKPYYHTVLSASAASLPAPDELPATNSAAWLKLWQGAVERYLKSKAASLTPGASIELAYNPADVITSILEVGDRSKTTLSGEDVDGLTASYVFKALAEVHGWNATIAAMVATALRQYAAPAHSKPAADASKLLQRLASIPELLTGDDSALDADIVRVHGIIAAKLTRDSNATAASLASI